MIKIDSEFGKHIGLTSERFSNATIWDSRPDALYVVQLVPKEPAEENLRFFLKECDKLGTPVHLVAQSDFINNIAAEYGYMRWIDPSGTPTWDNSASKFVD